MTGGSCYTRTGLCLLAVTLICLIHNYPVAAAPQPIPPGMMYREDYGVDVPSQILMEKLKEMVRKEDKIEKEIAELAEDQMEIQELTEAKNKGQKEQQQQISDFLIDDNEALPVPAAVYRNDRVHPGKRTSYMALCHFKICNMGRKRQM